jgi:hypothetical protein
MSELTPCNYCTLKSIKRRAEEGGMTVTLLNGDVYVHPATVAIKELSSGEDGEREQYWRAWFMKLTDHCVC